MHVLGRRNFIRGLGLGAGATLFAPFLREQIKVAQGATPSNGRALFVQGSWSYPERFLKPKAIRSSSDFDLNDTMAALTPHKQDLWVVWNMSAPGVGANGGHGINEPDFWSCMKSKDFFSQTGISFDRYLAQTLSKADRFSSVNVGIEGYDGTGRPYPAFSREKPGDLYDALFAKPVATDGMPAQALIDKKKSLLDFVLTDLKRMDSRLAGPEKQKLEVYASSLRDVETKLTATTSASCTPGARPTVTAKSTSAVALSDLSSDLAVLALGCGLTHVASVATEDYDWTALGATDTDGHNMMHDEAPCLPNVCKWRTGVAVKAYEQLSALGYADSSVVVLTDPNGTVHHGGTDPHFFAVGLGRLGGFLKGSNFVVFDRESTGANGPRGVGELFVALAQGFGVSTNLFGLESHCKGPMAAMLAG